MQVRNGSHLARAELAEDIAGSPEERVETMIQAKIDALKAAVAGRIELLNSGESAAGYFFSHFKGFLVGLLTRWQEQGVIAVDENADSVNLHVENDGELLPLLEQCLTLLNKLVERQAAIERVQSNLQAFKSEVEGIDVESLGEKLAALQADFKNKESARKIPGVRDRLTQMQGRKKNLEGDIQRGQARLGRLNSISKRLASFEDCSEAQISSLAAALSEMLNGDSKETEGINLHRQLDFSLPLQSQFRPIVQIGEDTDLTPAEESAPRQSKAEPIRTKKQPVEAAAQGKSSSQLPRILALLALVAAGTGVGIHLVSRGHEQKVTALKAAIQRMTVALKIEDSKLVKPEEIAAGTYDHCRAAICLQVPPPVGSVDNITQRLTMSTQPVTTVVTVNGEKHSYVGASTFALDLETALAESVTFTYDGEAAFTGDRSVVHPVHFTKTVSPIVHHLGMGDVDLVDFFDNLLAKGMPENQALEYLSKVILKSDKDIREILESELKNNPSVPFDVTLGIGVTQTPAVAKLLKITANGQSVVEITLKGKSGKTISVDIVL